MKVIKEIKKLELKIAKEKAKLAVLRDKVKPEPVMDYVLQTVAGKPVKLSSLFGKKNELILIHNMGSSCPYCTLWADGFNGMVHHLESRAAFVVESPDHPKTVAKFKKNRGWKFEMVSSEGSPFRGDMGFFHEKDGYCPGVSVFKKKGNKIFRVSESIFGPGDNYCVAWDLFDLLPGGAGNWGPEFNY